MVDMLGSHMNPLVAHFFITRFSVRMHGFRRGHAPSDERLFRPSYLDTRFMIFETFCLPSISGQSSKNFCWIILIDPKLPRLYRQRLQDLTSPYEFIRLVEYSDHMRLGKLAFIEEATGPIRADLVITTRLDDDDALCRDFVEDIQTQYMRSEVRNILYVSYPQGIYWYPDRRTTGGMFIRVNRPCLALGLSLAVVKNNFPLTIHGRSHMKIIHSLLADQRNPNSELFRLSERCGDPIRNWDVESKLRIIQSQEPVYIRTIHGANDNLDVWSGPKRHTAEPDLTRFCLGPSAVRHANDALAESAWTRRLRLLRRVVREIRIRIAPKRKRNAPWP